MALKDEKEASWQFWDIPFSGLVLSYEGIKYGYGEYNRFVFYVGGGNIGNIIIFPMRGTPKLTSTILIRKLPNYFTSNETIHLEAVGQTIPMDFAEKLFPSGRNSMNDTKKRMNSGLIYLALYGPDRTLIQEFDSEDAVLITFKHFRPSKGPSYETIWHKLYPGEKPTAIQGTEICAYWNIETNVFREWDTNGCRKLESGRLITKCVCKHLAAFTLLTNCHQYDEKGLMMEIISIVFSSLSVISLTMTLIALHFVEGSQEQRNSIEKHLCLCLLIGHVMALAVLDRSYFQLTQGVCVVVAVCFHYIFLAAFMWMAVEGHHLYRMVVRVFDSGRDFSKIYIYSGYGVPLVIVGITCTITTSLQDNGYANDELCWLSTPIYIWAFMGPVVILTLINLVVLVFAMKVAVTASTKQMQSFSERIKIWLKGWFSLSSLLGVTWIFGFFYIQFDHNFAYAFVTLNGLQGIIMFLTRVVFNEQVKSSIKSKTKQKIMMKGFYNFFAWNRKESKAKISLQLSPRVSRNSLQPNEACSASAIRFGDTTSRCRSSTKHSLSNDSNISTMDSKQNVNPFRPMTSSCKSLPSDNCATQSDKCRELVCNEEVIKYALQVCWMSPSINGTPKNNGTPNSTMFVWL
ncbi:adhesion G protein-coupled receptor E5-like [Cloeon dipterum]|uniref:adhesion G protein-coupled receptor E5-like n=1 Tax=Cloeon dipterum TaxID=197152 RepID=UPI00321FD1EC